MRAVFFLLPCFLLFSAPAHAHGSIPGMVFTVPLSFIGTVLFALIYWNGRRIDRGMAVAGWLSSILFLCVFGMLGGELDMPLWAAEIFLPLFPVFCAVWGYRLSKQYIKDNYRDPPVLKAALYVMIAGGILYLVKLLSPATFERFSVIFLR